MDYWKGNGGMSMSPASLSSDGPGMPLSPASLSSDGLGVPLSPASLSSDGPGVPMPHPKSLLHTSFFWGREMEVLFPGFPDRNLRLYLLALFLVFMLAANTEMPEDDVNVRKRKKREAFLYGIRMYCVYLLMLSVMSYNAGLFTAAIAGHTLGFYFI